MSDIVVNAQNLNKAYGDFQALKDLSLTLERGNIIGLIGPNGAGKTTLLKSLLGLLKCDGQLDVLGYDPHKKRNQILQQLCFVSDVGVLPDWATRDQLLNLTQKLHPKFRPEKALALLENTEIRPNAKVKDLSKGMKAQLHLSIILSMDVEILILDEPTLGLDILHRKQFLDYLVNDYFDATKTIIITTHQVEEIEEILTHLVFIKQGSICLDASMDEFRGEFHELEIPEERLDEANHLNPIYRRKILGKHIFMFENQDVSALKTFGEVYSPSIADVFVAKMSGNTADL